MSPRTRDLLDRLIGAGVMLALLLWVAYFWERSTGLTWATRSYPGRASTPAHLAQALRMAIGMTAFCVPLALVYFGLLRRKR